MRTRLALEMESRGLEEQARAARQEPLNLVMNNSRAGVRGPIPLFTFPESTVRINAASEFEGPLTHRMLRSIFVAENERGLEFSLIEEEIVSTGDGVVVRHYDPFDLIASDDVFDVLSAGYQRLDEDRLRERMEPIIDRIEAHAFAELADVEDVAEIEELASELALSVSARMRLKVDAIDLLEGRLEPGDFVARTVARQECYEKSQRLGFSQQITESIDL